MRWHIVAGDRGLSPGDRGLQYGDGLFETIAIRDGHPRLLERHLERLHQGCSRLAIDAEGLGYAAAALRELIGGDREGTGKIIVTRGSGCRGYATAGSGPPTIMAGFEPKASGAEIAAATGITAIMCRTRLGRNSALAGMKTLNRLEQIVARMEWDATHVFEGLMQDEHDLVICGTMTNIFIVAHGRLITPALDRCGVRGIMRGLVMEQAIAANIDLQEADCPASQLPNAAEIFVTNALIGLRPVIRIGERSYEVGPMTRAIAERLVARGVAEARF